MVRPVAAAEAIRESQTASMKSAALLAGARPWSARAMRSPRFIPDAGDPSTGVQQTTLTVERTLKGPQQGDLALSQSVTRTAQGTYTTAEGLYQPLVTGQHYAVAVLDRTEGGDRWVWGAERAPDEAADERWVAAVAAKAVLPTATCDDTRTVTSTPDLQ
ncbi:hypothetical protein ACFVV7_26985 [Streptomyces globisporus]|uniref:hypothetical protein n=1 Tax=Streptomyces globisporus TaxID=1908 RepID=UPI0036DF0A67